ncbi:MAG: ABC transporter permease subunit [Lachnospiraceae bacterium]|nr:ABC transporter permease subunit [Lachnospiraceae bacterium]
MIWAYIFILVPLLLILSFLVSVMVLPFRKRMQTFFKAVYFLPAIASGVALAFVWKWIFSPLSSGLLNRVMKIFGISAVNWMGSKTTAMGTLIAVAVFSGVPGIFSLLLTAMMVPYQVTQVPLYMLFVNNLHMQDTYVALIVPTLVNCYNVFLAKQFISSVPSALIEAAKIDGCSQPALVFRIVVPMSKTVLAVIAITTFLGEWNTFFWPFLITNSEAMQTIQVGLKNFSYANTTYFAPMMAGATVSALPMFILFFALQKYFLEGVTVGAVKG